jgi:HemY protein
MRALIWIIALFAVAAGLAMFAGANEGYVLVVLPPWRLQASLNLAVVALVVGFFLLYFLIRLVNRTLDLPGRVGAYRSRRRQEKAARSVREALRALFEGRFTDAGKQARVAFSAGDSGAEAALLAARAAHAQRDDRAYREWMGKAMSADGGRTSALLTEAELAIADGAWDAAEEALETLRKGDHSSAAASRLQLELARSRGDWKAVPDLVRQLLANRAIGADEGRGLVRAAHLAMLESLDGQPEELAEYWRKLGKEDHADRELVLRAVPLLARGGKGAVARKDVERLLDSDWDSALARRYALCAGDGEEARDALSRSERWLNRQPDDPGLLYALGRQCMAAQIWGKAQSYLERSLALDPRAETHLALADLFDATEHPTEAKAHFAHAARLATTV